MRLIIRPGAIGDLILSLPAMEAIADGKTEVWCSGAGVPLVRFAGKVRSIASTGLDRLGIVESGDVIERLRKFDSIFSWYGANRTDFRELVRCERLPFCFFDALPKTHSRVHATDFFLGQVGAAPGACAKIECPPRNREDFAVLHPFSGSQRKNWPLERFRELARRLERRMPVYWCKGPEDPLPGAVLIPDLWELAGWLSRARVFIGNDSGISHLAGACGTPVVALFGPTDPAVWAPRGPQVHVIARPRLEEISVAQVEEAIA